jgi:hypothetical protein
MKPSYTITREVSPLDASEWMWRATFSFTEKYIVMPELDKVAGLALLTMQLSGAERSGIHELKEEE